MILRSKPIAIFFTHGVSLAMWETRGILSREVEFYRALAEKTGMVWFFTYGYQDGSYQQLLGDKIKIFPKRIKVPNLMYAFLMPLLHISDLWQVKICRTHQMAGVIPALITSILLHKPLFVRCGFQWLAFVKRERARWWKWWIVRIIEFVAYHTSDVIILTTIKDAETVHHEYRIPESRITVIPNYVDTNKFKPLLAPKKPNSVCFVGRLEPQKNIFALIEGARNLNVDIHMYGDGSLKEHLRKKAQELRVNVFFYGTIRNEQLPTVLNAHEIFVLPSLYEGHPKALLEAMACGMPSIGTNVEGINTTITHNVDGVLCETDAQSIHQTLADLLHEVEKRKRLGQAARQTILQICSLESIIQQEQLLIDGFGIHTGIPNI